MWKDFAEALSQTFGRADPGPIDFSVFYWKNRKVIAALKATRGLFNTDNFEKWLDDQIRQKVKVPAIQRRVLFSDLTPTTIPLKIIATDLSNKAIIQFSKDATPLVSIAEAVSASISIPYFFSPKKIALPNSKEPVEAIDGGLLSNFPAWVFDTERRQLGPNIPTLGFRLIEQRREKVEYSQSLGAYSGQLALTVLEGDQQLEVREIENLQLIPLYVPSSTFDFDMDDGAKDLMYTVAEACAQKALFRLRGIADPTLLNTLLEFCHLQMLSTLNRKDAHLRVNVVTLTTKGTLRVTYCFNMDNDADDRLEFPTGSGASGECWSNHEPVLCNLVQAATTYKTTWRMDKYQQAHVRRSAIGLLCLPIFDPDKYNPNAPVTENPLIGVLNFDSDDIQETDFAQQNIINKGIELALIIAKTGLKPLDV